MLTLAFKSDATRTALYAGSVKDYILSDEQLDERRKREFINAFRKIYREQTKKPTRVYWGHLEKHPTHPASANRRVFCETLSRVVGTFLTEIRGAEHLEAVTSWLEHCPSLRTSETSARLP